MRETNLSWWKSGYLRYCCRLEIATWSDAGNRK